MAPITYYRNQVHMWNIPPRILFSTMTKRKLEDTTRGGNTRNNRKHKKAKVKDDRDIEQMRIAVARILDRTDLLAAHAKPILPLLLKTLKQIENPSPPTTGDSGNDQKAWQMRKPAYIYCCLTPRIERVGFFLHQSASTLDEIWSVYGSLQDETELARSMERRPRISKSEAFLAVTESQNPTTEKQNTRSVNPTTRIIRHHICIMYAQAFEDWTKKNPFGLATAFSKHLVHGGPGDYHDDDDLEQEARVNLFNSAISSGKRYKSIQVETGLSAAAVFAGFLPTHFKNVRSDDIPILGCQLRSCSFGFVLKLLEALEPVYKEIQKRTNADFGDLISTIESEEAIESFRKKAEMASKARPAKHCGMAIGANIAANQLKFYDQRFDQQREQAR